MRHLLRLAATSILALTAIASAQELAVAPPGSPRLTFDVISIHPALEPGPGTKCSIKSRKEGDGYQVRCMHLVTMMSLMYKIPESQITGGPAQLMDLLWDVDARADKAYSLDDLHSMFQSMLADRFRLKFHTESRERNIYALTILGSGLKMKPDTGPEDLRIPLHGGPNAFTGIRVPMNYLCWRLEEFLQNDERPVINMTGLTGNYDFKLAFHPELPPGFDMDKLPQEVRDLPDLFTALREQLGLKLTAQKGPATYIVIDHIEKPSEN